MSLPKQSLFEKIGADVATVEVANLTPRPDFLQAANSSAGNVCVFLRLDYNDQTGIDRHWKYERDSQAHFWNKKTSIFKMKDSHLKN